MRNIDGCMSIPKLLFFYSFDLHFQSRQCKVPVCIHTLYFISRESISTLLCVSLMNRTLLKIKRRRPNKRDGMQRKKKISTRLDKVRTKRQTLFVMHARSSIKVLEKIFIIIFFFFTALWGERFKVLKISEYSTYCHVRQNWIFRTKILLTSVESHIIQTLTSIFQNVNEVCTNVYLLNKKLLGFSSSLLILSR